MLIMSASTPKSEMIKIGTAAATASSAAVEETVASPAAVGRTSAIAPVWNASASGPSRPAATNSAASSRIRPALPVGLLLAAGAAQFDQRGVTVHAGAGQDEQDLFAF